MKKTILILLMALVGGVSALAQDGRPIFLGLNGTAGFPFNTRMKDDAMEPYRENAIGFGVKAGLDFAYPITDNFALGAYIAIGSGPSFIFRSTEEGMHDISCVFDATAGLLMLAGNLREQPFIIGVAPLTGFGYCDREYLPVEVRFGRLLKNDFYITGNLLFGVPPVLGIMFEPSISLGFNFGPRLKRAK